MADNYRVIVTGSRTFARPALIYEALNGILAAVSLPLVVVHGQCDPLEPVHKRRVSWRNAARFPAEAQVALLGADWHAHLWARTSAVANYPVASEEAHPAAWEGPCRPGCGLGHRRGGWDGRPSYCPAAGDYRNEHMVSLGASVVLAAADPCSQTRCARRAAHDSHGTANCIRLAEAAGIEVRRVNADD